MKISTPFKFIGKAFKVLVFWILGTIVLMMMVSFLISIIKVGGFKHYPFNEPLPTYALSKGYYIENSKRVNNFDKLTVVLAFSGGGTRAAAFAYGVLEELADIEITFNGKTHRLIDEVDLISSVSGGSFTAAYYGLNGDRIFEDFEDVFLRKNVQQQLIMKVFHPLNWGNLLSNKYSRSDTIAEYYDENIFKGKTFNDILKSGGPFVIINATDLTLGERFAFIQPQFNLLCSDLIEYPIARAVAASAAIAPIISPITIKNYAGTCNYYHTEWIEKTLSDPDTSRRVDILAKRAKSYLDAKARPKVHLMDGGISDNLGIRTLLDIIFLRDIQSETKQHAVFNRLLANDTHVLLITVNAQIPTEKFFPHRRLPPSLRSILLHTSGVTLKLYNFETLELLRTSVELWEKNAECGKIAKIKNNCKETKYYLAEVNFDLHPDEHEQEYLADISTTFDLSDQEVDRLRQAARYILRNSHQFKEFLNDIAKDQ